MVREPVVFAIQVYRYLQEEICSAAGFTRGEVETRPFPDGERYQRICGEVLDRDVVLVGGTVSDEATLELYDLASALVKYGAGRLTMVIPYFGYSTMERAVRPGEVVTAKTRARLLSTIPPAARGNRVFLLDLHTEGVAHYFEEGLTARHIFSTSLVCEAARMLGGDDFVIGCTDAGRAKWVESMANVLGVQPGFVFKRRLSGTATEVSAVSAQVRGKQVVIYDDMIRTGGSLIHAAQAYADAGATGLSAITSHGLFPGDALERIKASGLFSQVVCTNSHPRAVLLADDFLNVRSIAGLLIEQLRLR